MFKLAEKFISANRTGLEAFRTIVNTSLDGIGQLATLNLQTARAFVESGAGNLAALSEVRDLEGLMALRQPAATAAAEQSFAYSRRAYEIYSESSSKIVQVFDQQLAGIGGGLAEAVQKGGRSVSPAVDFAVSTARSLMAMASRTCASARQPVADVAVTGGAQTVKLIEKTA